MTRCPSCHSTDVALEEEVPAEGVLIELYVWLCGSCPRKWVTN